MKLSKNLWVMAAVFVSGIGVSALALNRTWLGDGDEDERVVTEKEVPKAALEMLKKVAGKAKITKYEEETEHGQKYYEGGWEGENGRVEALVTTTGDLVEIEEVIANDKVPHAVLAAAQKEAGADTKLKFEKKTMYLYEAHFKKGEKFHELVLTADARATEREEKNKED